MPAAAPPVTPPDLASLARLGARLQAARKKQKVSAVAAAEAAGISRVTLHRIERGEPSVAMGAWVAVAGALGLSIDLASGETTGSRVEPLPETIRLDEYPQLKRLAWQLPGVEELTPREALDLYERNWRHVEGSSLSMKEIELINALSRALGGGRLLV
jgi:transcriptional regulator with XRE-family HTH domain